MNSSSGKYKIILGRLVTATITLVVLVVASLAWLAKNREVSGTGMGMNAYVPASLVIWTDKDNAKNYLTSVDISYQNKVGYIKPCTHAWQFVNAAGVLDNTSTGLIYNTNSNSVKMVTGLGAGPDSLTFAGVRPNTGYYIDYFVNISSIVKPMKVSSLDVSIGFDDSKPTLKTDDYRKALSVDFYLLPYQTSEISEETYVGTLNVAGYTNEIVGGSFKPLTSINLLKNSDIDTIPNIKTGGGVTVYMRVYYDGALLYTNPDPADYSKGITYVRAEGLRQQDVGLDIVFDATEVYSDGR